MPISKAGSSQARDGSRFFLEASLDPLVTIGPDGKITDVNAATEVVTGCPRTALIGTDFSDYFTEPEKARAGYQQVFREGEVRDYALDLKRRDGRITSVLYNASVYRDKRGKVIGVFAAARDVTARKQAQEALRRANAYNRSLLEASLDPLVTIGPDGKITDVNAATEAVTGCARAALIGTDFSDYFTQPEKARAGYQQVFREGMVRDYPLDLRHRDGGITSVLYNASVYRDETGEVIGVFAAARDVTARKRAEEAVRRANAYNRSLLEASLDPLVTIGPDGKITDVNAATEAVTGCGRAALIGTDFSDYFTEPEKARAGYQEVFREGFARDYALELRHQDGRIRSVLYNASLYRDESGRVIGVFAAARDITGRKRAEEAVRASELRYRSLFETMDEGFCVVEMLFEPDGKARDYRFLEVNPAFEKQTGLREAQGKTMRELAPEHEAHWFETYGNIALTGQPARFVNEAKALQRWYDVSAFRLGGPESRKVAILFNDITERRRAEEQIRRYAEDLRQSNKDLEHFAYVASHDLQEPLRTVSSFAQLLGRRYQGKLDTDADEFIAFIVDAAARMQALIQDLLAFSRIGTRGHPFTTVAGEDMVKQARQNLEIAVAESRAVITHDPLPMLLADPGQLTQLFQNLLSNAMKFRRPEERPRIHISATREHDAWRLSVHDNGIGIEPQYFDRIFIVFQRLHEREEYPGTGIGLALCKKIVERHGGRMWVESAPGKGSTFHFTIPDQKRNYEPAATTDSAH